MSAKRWYVFGRENVTGDLAGTYMTMVAGPTIKKESEVKKRIPNGMSLLASFDHEPSDLEKDQCQPRSFRQFNPDGSEIDWDAYSFDTPMECQRAGFHLKLKDEHGNCSTCGDPNPDPEAELRAAIESIQGES